MESDTDSTYMRYMKQFYEQHLPVHKGNLAKLKMSVSSISTQTVDSNVENYKVNRSTCIFSEPHNIRSPHGDTYMHGGTYKTHYKGIVKHAVLDNVVSPLQEDEMSLDHANTSQETSVSIKAEQNLCISNGVTVKIEPEDAFNTSLLSSEEGDCDKTAVNEHIDTYISSGTSNDNIMWDIIVKQESSGCDFIENRDVEAPSLFEDVHVERDLETKCTTNHTNNRDTVKVCRRASYGKQQQCLAKIDAIKDEIIDDGYNMDMLENNHIDTASDRDSMDADANEQPFLEIDIVKDELGKCSHGSELCQSKSAESMKPSSNVPLISESMTPVFSKKLKLDNHPNHRIEVACTECGNKYLSKAGLKKHMRTNHGGSGSHRCGDCFKILATKYDLERHSKSCPKLGYCKSSSTTIDSLKKPDNKIETGICVAVHDGVKKVTEETCVRIKAESSKFTGFNSVEVEEPVRLIKSRKIYKCIVCGKTLASMHTLTDHMRIHTGERPYQCIECGKAFTQKSAHDVHKRVHTGEKPYHCSKCPRSFRHSADLKSHSLTPCRQIVTLTCENCSIAFTTQETYEKHLVLIHGKQAKRRPYECTKCEKSFMSPTHLQRHQLVHTQKRVYECFVCERPFIYSQHLQRHMKSHHKESFGLSKYSCDLCGKGFNDLAELKEHQHAMHNCKDKACAGYNCKECGMLFSTKAGLGVHVYVKHASTESKDKYTIINNMLKELLLRTDRPHDERLCPICNVQFSHMSSRNKHFREKHLVKGSNGELLLKTDPLDGYRGTTSCPICNAQFSSGSNRNKHFRQKHLKKESSGTDRRQKSSKFMKKRKHI